MPPRAAAARSAPWSRRCPRAGRRRPAPPSPAPSGRGSCPAWRRGHRARRSARRRRNRRRGSAGRPARGNRAAKATDTGAPREMPSRSKRSRCSSSATACEHRQVGVQTLGPRPGFGQPAPGPVVLHHRATAASGVKNARYAGSCHSSSRWLIQAEGPAAPGRSRGGVGDARTRRRSAEADLHGGSRTPAPALALRRPRASRGGLVGDVRDGCQPRRQGAPEATDAFHRGRRQRGRPGRRPPDLR